MLFYIIVFHITETIILKTPAITEEYFNDEEIISLVQFEEMGENGNDSSSDEELPLIPVKNAINGLETFINFFEQQKNNEKFKIDDLRIFRKYLATIQVAPAGRSSVAWHFNVSEPSVRQILVIQSPSAVAPLQAPPRLVLQRCILRSHTSPSEQSELPIQTAPDKCAHIVNKYQDINLHKNLKEESISTVDAHCTDKDTGEECCKEHN
nr:10210_t:CDS:2 [Entrophospora candida]